jgi:hypothetical protein
VLELPELLEDLRQEKIEETEVAFVVDVIVVVVLVVEIVAVEFVAEFEFQVRKWGLQGCWESELVLWWGLIL